MADAPTSSLSPVQRELIEKALGALGEAGFDGVVLLVSGTTLNKKKKRETFDESFFLGNMHCNVKLVETAAEQLDAGASAEPGELEPDDDDDEDKWKTGTQPS